MNPITYSGPRLIIVCGLPGSGKTTHAREVTNQLRAVRLCPDEWLTSLSINLHDEIKREKIEILQWKLGRELLALGLVVVIEWGTWYRAERDALRLEARALGAGVDLHYLCAPVEVLFERIQHRALENSPIEYDSILEWSNQFQAPNQEEMALYDAVFLSSE